MFDWVQPFLCTLLKVPKLQPLNAQFSLRCFQGLHRWMPRWLFFRGSCSLDVDCVFFFCIVHEKEYPRMAAAARDYLVVPASVVSVERLFSAGREMCLVYTPWLRQLGGAGFANAKHLFPEAQRVCKPCKPLGSLKEPSHLTSALGVYILRSYYKHQPPHGCISYVFCRT